MSSAFIQIENVSKSYGAARAVDSISLAIERGAFYALLGPSGCGKTTLLRMLSGFEVADEGRILIDGVDMSHVPPNKRPVNMVFQSYAVFPHMSVRDNVAYGLKMEGVAATQRHKLVAEALELVKLEDYGARKPDQLSGGQRQRVALARALVKRPKVLLLDEPLSALDAKLREAMRFELKRIQSSVGITFIMVTHDQEEAMATASRCALMHNGRLQQVGAPNTLYEYPANRFTADFIGSVNLIEGRLIADERDHALIEAPDWGAKIYLDHGITAAPEAALCIALRPEKIELFARHSAQEPERAHSPQGTNLMAGVISNLAYQGAETVYEVTLAHQASPLKTVKTRLPNLSRYAERSFDIGQPVWLSWHPQAPAILQD
jgi:spermidine/putrescine ABC transporter ATP-binding subunit